MKAGVDSGFQKRTECTNSVQVPEIYIPLKVRQITRTLDGAASMSEAFEKGKIYRVLNYMS